MRAEGSWADIEKTLLGLPGCNDDLFRRLWTERGLSFASSEQAVDYFDEYSARLVCASCKLNQNLFIVLPDNSPRRPALLFATALVRSWYDTLQGEQEPGGSEPPPVIYFGTAIGIRQQLASVTVGSTGLNLSEVFSQDDLSRQGSGVGASRSRTGMAAGSTPKLPTVVTSYSPADPGAIMERHRPDWVAVDCADAPDLHWLRPLLEYAKEKGIWVVAWGHNPLSEHLDLFKSHGEVFPWPTSFSKGSTSLSKGSTTSAPDPGSPSKSLDAIFTQDVAETDVQPLVLDGATVGSLDEPLGKARRVLVRATRKSLEPLGMDALRAHWRCLNALAVLPVPLGFYESEVQDLWGLEPVAKLLRSCEVFSEACRQNYPELAQDLGEAGIHLKEAVRALEEDINPPMWEALCGMCIDSPEAGEARLLTFSGNSRKQLFSLALLARHDITQAELSEVVSTKLASLNDLRKWLRWSTNARGASEDALDLPDPDLVWHPVLAGLPSSQVTPKLTPMLTHGEVGVIVYPHQRGAFGRRASEWSSRLNPSSSLAARAVQRLGGSYTSDPEAVPSTKDRVKVKEALALDSGDGRVVGRGVPKSLWEPEEVSDSVGRLLRITEEEPEPEESFGEESIGDSEEGDSGRETWCEDALEIRFTGGRIIRFEPDTQVNVVVRNGGSTGVDRRFVRSVDAGDRLLLIHGQRRQNLYDLVISRVHRNPSVELRTALVKRWQEDFAVAYQRWKRYGERNLDQLLVLMGERGSELNNSLTLRHWLWGNTLCPQDKEDLRRLAEILDMAFVKEHYKRVHEAARYLRGLHIGLSNRMNRWLEQQVSGTAQQDDNELIDRELGLSFGDFRSSLQVLIVERTHLVQGPFLRTTLGRIGDGT